MADLKSQSDPIRFGDVVKLYVKTGDTATAMGFLECKGPEHLLVMPPAKDKEKSEFQEAEFIITATRCEKPPADGSPLNYKQPFVLKTSSTFEEYSLNNKMNSEDTIGLQCRDVKGEMYLTIEKEGYTMEANVMNNDDGLDVVVVNSNRMRKKYNKKLAVYSKKNLEYLSCGSKGKPVNLQIIKVPDVTATKQFVKTQIKRRRSTLTQSKIDEIKADETSRANRVNSDSTDGGGGDALSPTSVASAPSPVDAAITATPIPESSEKSEKSKESNVETPTTAAAFPANAKEPTKSTKTKAEPMVTITMLPPEDLLTDIVLEEKKLPIADVAIPPSTATIGVPKMPPGYHAKDKETTATTDKKKDKKKEKDKHKDTAAPVSTDATAASSPKKSVGVATPAATGDGPHAATLPPPKLATNGPTTTTTASSAAATTAGEKSTTTPLNAPPSPRKIGQHEHKKSAATVSSEHEQNGDEKIESTCLGGNQCAIM